MGKVVKTVSKVVSVAGAIMSLIPPVAPVGHTLMAAGFVASGVMGLINGGPKKPKLDSSAEDNGHLINSRKITENIPVVYGTCRVGGNWIWAETGGENNKYLYVVMSVCEAPIYDITNLYINGTPIEKAPQRDYIQWSYIYTDPNDNGYIQSTEISSLRRYKWDSILAQKYSYDYIVNSVVLLGFVITYDREKWQSAPVITAEIKGVKLYDPRSGRTVYSDNPALAALDFLRNPRYGLGIDDSRIDFDSFGYAATYCDNNNFKFNGIVSGGRRWDLFNEILSHFNGSLYRSGGKYRIQISDLNNEVPVMTIGNDDIIAGTFKYTAPTLIGSVNTINVQILDPEINYQVSKVVVEDKETVSSSPSKATELRLLGASRDQAIRIANYILKRNKLNKSLSLTLSPKALALEPGDVVSVTYDDFGIQDKLYRITKISYNNNDTVNVSLIEEDYNLYDWVTSTISGTFPDTNLPDPLETPPKVSAVTLAEEGYQREDGSWKTRIKIDFTEPDNYFISHYEVWIQENDSNFNHIGNLPAEYPGNTLTYYYENVDVRKTYTIRIRSVNIYDNKSDFTENNILITGKDAAPSDVSNFRCYQSGNYVVLVWDHIPDKDLKGYQIREGASWESGRIILDNISKNTAYWRVPFDGTYRFFIKAKDAFGTLSRNAAQTQIVVSGIEDIVNIIYRQDEFLTSPPLQGAKNNVVYVDNGNYLTIPCSLTDTDVPDWLDTTPEITNYDGSSVLVGEYTTNVIDLGQKTQYTARVLPINYTAVNRSVTDQTYPDRTDTTYPNDTDIHITAEININYELQYSDDNVTYASEEFTGVVDQTSQYVKFLVRLTIDTDSTLLKVSNFEYVVDVPEKDYYLPNQAIDAAGTVFDLTTLNIIFYKEYFVGVTAQGGYYASVTNKTLTGFTVTLYDSAGNAVAGTVDIHLRGY